MLNVMSEPRLALLPSRRFRSSPLRGSTRIQSQSVDPRFLDAYDDHDRRCGLALFDPEFRREAFVARGAFPAPEEISAHAPIGGVAALAS